MRSTASLLLLFFCAISNVAFAQQTIKPAFSEFSIVFPNKPTENIFSFTGNDGVDADAVNYGLVTNNGMLKAEFVQITDVSLLDAITDAQIRQQMLDYMRHNGLKSSHVEVEHKGKIRIATGRSTKIISSGGAKTAVTYLSRTYYGRRSMLMIYVGAPSTDYPTETITAFLASVTY